MEWLIDCYLNGMLLSRQSEAVPNPGIQDRRSSRVPLVIPISIAGVHPDTSVRFEAFGKTLVVNQHGALISTISVLKAGMRLCITVETSGKSVWARVVWDTAHNEGRYGIELDAPDNPWGISPDDWVT
jgi:hypothetical protein